MTNSSVYWASLNSELLHLPVEVAFSLFNKDAYFTHPCMPLHPVRDRRTDHNFTMAMDILSSDPLTSLLKVLQDGCPIEEFLNISNRVPWKERTLKTIFWGGLDDHIYQQMPVSDTICSLERYIEYALWPSGSSFTVGEVADCPVDKTVSPTSPTTAARTSNIPTSASTFPWARKVISNSVDLGAKVADPAITSVRSALKSAFHPPFSAPRTNPVLRSKPTATSHPNPPAAADSSPPVPAPRQHPPAPCKHLPVSGPCKRNPISESTVTLSQDGDSAATVTLSWLSAANAMLYHWATGTLSMQLNFLSRPLSFLDWSTAMLI